MTDQSKEVIRARELLHEQRFGVLSTHSVAVPGYPFGTVTPYCLDRLGQPIILISGLAQHTRNIDANPRVSLTVMEGGEQDILTRGRLTCLADAAKVEESREDEWGRYFRYFPTSRGFHESLDFSFYRLNLSRILFIAGFGQIHWIESKDFVIPNPFTAEAETSLVTHMNTDHQDAMRHYCRSLKDIPVDNQEIIAMVGVDSEGFDLRVGGGVVRFTFPHRVGTTDEARKAFIALSKG